MKILKQFRKDKSLTQSEMAKTLGISESLYEKIERGIRTPSQNFLQRFKAQFPSFDMNLFFLKPKRTKRARRTLRI